MARKQEGVGASSSSSRIQHLFVVWESTLQETMSLSPLSRDSKEFSLRIALSLLDQSFHDLPNLPDLLRELRRVVQDHMMEPQSPLSPDNKSTQAKRTERTELGPPSETPEMTKMMSVLGSDMTEAKLSKRKKYHAEERKQTAVTRKEGACEDCRVKRRRCKPSHREATLNEAGPLQTKSVTASHKKPRKFEKSDRDADVLSKPEEYTPGLLTPPTIGENQHWTIPKTRVGRFQRHAYSPTQPSAPSSLEKGNIASPRAPQANTSPVASFPIQFGLSPHSEMFEASGTTSPFSRRSSAAGSQTHGDQIQQQGQASRGRKFSTSISFHTMPGAEVNKVGRQSQTIMNVLGPRDDSQMGHYIPHPQLHGPEIHGIQDGSPLYETSASTRLSVPQDMFMAGRLDGEAHIRGGSRTSFPETSSVATHYGNSQSYPDVSYEGESISPGVFEGDSFSTYQPSFLSYEMPSPGPDQSQRDHGVDHDPHRPGSWTAQDTE